MKYSKVTTEIIDINAGDLIKWISIDGNEIIYAIITHTTAQTVYGISIYDTRKILVDNAYFPHTVLFQRFERVEIILKAKDIDSEFYELTRLKFKER